MVARSGCELVANSGPALIVDQGRLLTGVEFTLVSYVAGVNWVREQCVEMTEIAIASANKGQRGATVMRRRASQRPASVAAPDIRAGRARPSPEQVALPRLTRCGAGSGPAGGRQGSVGR